MDIFPYDYAPAGEAERSKLAVKLTKLSREILMKCHFTPWAEENRIHLGKRIGYLYYQIKTIFRTREELIRDYEGLIRAVPKDPVVYTQCAWKHVYYFEKCWFDGNRKETFEDGEFPVPVEAEKCLKAAYGDYMTPPPEDQRENRHQILEIDFGA